MTDSRQLTDDLIDLLHEQEGLIEQLSELAVRQGDLIQSGNSGALLELLADRQQIMDQFLARQDHLASLADEVRQAVTPGDPTREHIGGLIESITDRLSEIVERDEQDRESLATRREQTRSALAALGTAKQAHRAYVQSKTAGARFADRQG